MAHRLSLKDELAGIARSYEETTRNRAAGLVEKYMEAFKSSARDAAARGAPAVCIVVSEPYDIRNIVVEELVKQLRNERLIATAQPNKRGEQNVKIEVSGWK